MLDGCKQFSCDYFQNTDSFIGRFVKSISLCNVSFKAYVLFVKFSVALRVYYSNVLIFISVFLP